jgi:hypothetical protein
MPTSKNTFLATAAALALGWSLLGPGVTVGEEKPTSPPKNLKLVGDHWTPYNPPDPESFPPDATLHIIVKGETLWGMADLTYNNPYLWPQLWDANRYITDSHWIYPGDPLLLPPRPVVVSDGTGATIVPQGQEGAPPTSLEPMPSGEEALQEPLAAQTAPPATTGSGDSGPRPRRYDERDLPLVDESDIRCAGFIVESGKRNELFIAENEEPGFDGITTGTLVYLNHGADDASLQPGAEFNIVEREGKVMHPLSHSSSGYFVRRLGELRVLKILADTAIAAVTFACDEIRVGNELIAIEHQPVPNRPAPAFDRLRFERNGKAVGWVIHAADTLVRTATGDLVSIDLGREDGLNPGDFLTAFEPMRRGKRPHQSAYHFEHNNMIFESADLHYDDTREEFPAKPVGQMVVVSTASHTSTVKIIHSIAEVHVGTMVEVD